MKIIHYIIVPSVLTALITGSCSKDVPIVENYQNIAETITIQSLSAEMMAVRDYVPQFDHIATLLDCPDGEQ